MRSLLCTLLVLAVVAASVLPAAEARCGEWCMPGLTGKAAPEASCHATRCCNARTGPELTASCRCDHRAPTIATSAMTGGSSEPRLEDGRASCRPAGDVRPSPEPRAGRPGLFMAGGSPPSGARRMALLASWRK